MNREVADWKRYRKHAGKLGLHPTIASAYAWGGLVLGHLPDSLDEAMVAYVTWDANQTAHALTGTTTTTAWQPVRRAL